MENPVEKLRRLVAECGVPNVIITNPTDLHYISGVPLSRGTLLVSPTGATLYVDPRYAFLSSKGLPFDVVVALNLAEERRLLQNSLSAFSGEIGFDPVTMSVDQWESLSALSGRPLRGISHVVSMLRRPKRPDEIEAIATACRLCEKGYQHLLTELREGVTEDELARSVKCFWFQHGADDISFEPIIAFGPNSACPHWIHSSERLVSGVPVLMDIGVQVGSYHSDMTRTVFFGRPDPKLLACQKVVHQAYEHALTLARPGMRPHDLDAAIRNEIFAAGYEGCFGHGLGHGIGLKIHESPRLSPSSPNEPPLLLGDVIAIEPGIYLPGIGGVRFENTVVVGEDGSRALG